MMWNCPLRSGCFLLFAGLSTALAAAESAVPMIVAHRGASHDAPENTLAAFELAWQRGADAIEGDFYLTRDGKIVCFHDGDTKRTAPTAPKRRVADLTLAELQQLDVGRWKDARFAGQRPPTLTEVLQTIPAKKKIFVEIKSGPEILPELKRVLESSGLADDQIVIISFNKAVIAGVRQQLPQYKANWLTSFKSKPEVGWEPNLNQVLQQLQGTAATGLGSKAEPRVVDRDFVRAIRDAGFEMHCWTVNDAALARLLVQRGVQSITTDRPAFIRQQLAPPRR